MYFVVKLLVNTLALLMVVQLIPGIHIADWKTAIFAALGLGFVNAVIRPVVMVLTLPLNVLTLGLLTFIINALLFYSVSAFVPGFTVSGFPAALLGSLLFSIISSVLNMVAAPPRVRFFSHRPRADHPGPQRKYKDAIDVESRREKDEQ